VCIYIYIYTRSHADPACEYELCHRPLPAPINTVRKEEGRKTRDEGERETRDKGVRETRDEGGDTYILIFFAHSLREICFQTRL
jgi:hypothetical protein